MKSSRNINLDIIRSVALIYVICVHFFLNTNFYSYGPIHGLAMETSIILRNCFAACVPLFIMLSGYLMNKKNFSIKYYAGISKVFILYGLSCITIWIYQSIEYQTIFTLDSLFKSFVSYEGYAWYIGFYFGLYALIPFFNLMYHGLDSKRAKNILLFILLIFTALPTITNKFGVNLIPQNWESLYPLTYYFMGAYLSEYADDIKLSPKLLFILYILVVISGGMFVNRFVRGHMYYSIDLFSNWNSVLNFSSTFLLFLTILKCDFSKMPKLIAKFFEILSKVSLQMYLVSYMFDHIVYSEFNAMYPIYEDRFIRFFEPIIKVFVGSFIVALIIQFIYDQIRKLTSDTKKV